MDLWFLHFANGIDYQRWLLWIPLLPLVSALLLGTVPPLLRRWQRTASHFDREAEKLLVNALGVGSVTVAFVLAVGCFLRLGSHAGAAHGSIDVVGYDWFRLALGDARIPVR